MKIRSLLSLMAIVLAAFLKLSAQTPEKPWMVYAGVDLVNLLGDEVDKNLELGLPALGASRYLGYGFSVGAQFALNKVANKGVDYKYKSLDGIVKYNLINKKIIPYLFAGYGITMFSDGIKRKGLFPSVETSYTPLGGIGLNYFFADNWGLNLSSSYRHAKEDRFSYNHLQHVVGLSYSFGVRDADRDGVSDKKDSCPDIPGLKEFAGCPDTDSDGIADNEDACPEEAGVSELNGCPDSDGDGITDKQDACPKKAGSPQTNGCPDSDGDGVPDNRDNCPNEVGSIENNGCPLKDSDRDGVVDRDDRCPNEAGLASNYGCPKKKVETEPTDLIVFINSDRSTVLFRASNDKLNSRVKNTLNELKSLLDLYPSSKITVEGHSSSDGSSAYNQKLSKKRAASVKAYLVSLGISDSRIKAVGYGEAKPVADNNTAKGRAANRRVKINQW